MTELRVDITCRMICIAMICNGRRRFILVDCQESVFRIVLKLKLKRFRPPHRLPFQTNREINVIFFYISEKITN